MPEEQKTQPTEEKKEEIPTWLRESLRNTLLVEFMFKAFEEKCDCKICQELRRLAKDYQNFITSFLEKK